MAKKKTDIEYKVMKIRCKDNNLIAYFKRKMYATKHFENILLILIDQDYAQNNGANFKYLTNGDVMRAVLRDNEGGKQADKVAFVKDYYKDNQLMQDLIKVSQSLKIHNLVEQIKDVKKNYDGFFTKIKNGDTEARTPKPKKLSKINSMTIFMDGYKSFSYKHRKKSKQGKVIGFNLDSKMRYTHIPHEHIIKVVEDMDNIRSMNINYSNGNFYFLLNYSSLSTSLKSEKVRKYAGLDPGVDNLVSIYIDDEESKSLIIDGHNYIDYNAKFNRFIGQISSEIQYNRNLDDIHKEGLKIDLEIKRLCKFRSFLYEKRNNFFYSEFHKLSKRILEYLKSCGVTHLAIPENLASLKYNGDCGLRKDIKQSFIQIPFMQLIKNIKDKAYKYGITTIKVDEAYTSKTSSLTQDINLIHHAAFNHAELWQFIRDRKFLSANAFRGKRAKRTFKESKGHRGDYYDYYHNVIINSDLNGAKNICSVGKKTKCENYNIVKLCNPIKVKSEHELLNFIKNDSDRIKSSLRVA